MKVVAVYNATVAVHVELGEFETWEEAAAAAARREVPPPPDKIQLYLETIWRHDDDSLEYECGHEIVGVCALCGAGIVDGCGLGGCDGAQHAKGSGWTSTKHGHRTWCSVECREKDPEDPERHASGVGE